VQAVTPIPDRLPEWLATWNSISWVIVGALGGALPVLVADGTVGIRVALGVVFGSLMARGAVLGTWMAVREMREKKT